MDQIHRWECTQYHKRPETMENERQSEQVDNINCSQQKEVLVLAQNFASESDFQLLANLDLTWMAKSVQHISCIPLFAIRLLYVRLTAYLKRPTPVNPSDDGWAPSQCHVADVEGGMSEPIHTYPSQESHALFSRRKRVFFAFGLVLLSSIVFTTFGIAMTLDPSSRVWKIILTAGTFMITASVSGLMAAAERSGMEILTMATLLWTILPDHVERLVS